MNHPWRQQTGVLALAVAVLLTGCRSSFESPAPPMPENQAAGTDFNLALLHAAESKKPLLVLVAEPGQSRADDDACALLESPVVKTNAGILAVLMDVGVSRNRATATRFHVVETPLLLCLSSKRIIISRDEKPITKKILSQRIDEAIRQSPELDAKFVSLDEAVRQNPNNAAAQFALTDFLLAHHNAFEAVSHLEAVAHSDVNAPELRVRAWVALARAHLWIAEPEKGRHEANDLIATLGPTTPEARAGGNLVLGLQDANAKRPGLALAEFLKAVAASPESSYGKEASDAMSKLNVAFPPYSTNQTAGKIPDKQ